MALAYWLAAHLQHISTSKLLSWLQTFNTIENLFHATINEWQAAGLSATEIQLMRTIPWKEIEKLLAWHSPPTRTILHFDDQYYPPLLKSLVDAPLVLYVEGDINLLSLPQIAMVGSRKASPIGLRNAEQFAHDLSEVGLIVTSGLALGIDAASHRGALQAQAPTIAVFGTGLNYIYPPTHQKLAQDILNYGGVFISEFPLDMPPRALNFPVRNRIISGLALGVLIVEAALKSGSLITARLALEQGREVFAIPGAIQHRPSKGCHYLIKQGGAKLVESIQDILEELTMLSPNSLKLIKENQKIPSKSIDLEQKAMLVFDQLAYETVPLDVIILRSGLTRGEVSSILLALELNGIIRAAPGGYIRAC